MKKIISALLIITSALLISSCGGDKTTSSDTSSTTTTAADSLTGSTMMADTTHDMSKMTPAPDLTGAAGPTNFATTVAGNGMMEVEAAKLAQKNATSKEVKDLASMLLTDHTKANADLKKIAGQKNMVLPTTMPSDHQAHMDMLRSKTGADFDAAYLKMMDEGHTKSIVLFQQASTMLSDADLKTFASKTLPTLEKHSEKVKAILSKM